MAITSALSTSFKRQLLSGSAHTPSHTYKMALFQSMALLDAATTVYSASSAEVTGSGYTAGGTVLQGIVIDQTGTTAYIDWTTDPSWASATFTARGCQIWNTSGSASVATFDFGQDYTATNGTFTVQLPAAGATAVIRIA